MSATRTPHKGKGRPKASGKNAPRRNLVLPIAFGVVALLALVAILASTTNGGDDDGGNGSEELAQTREVEVSGTPLAPYDKEQDTAIGSIAPVAQGTTFEGDPITIGNDEAQVVFFVAHWCPHCQREVPVITEWLEEEGAPEGVSLRAVSTGVDERRGNYPASEWLEREGWPVETLVDDERSTVANAFGLTGYPFFVAINGDGEVVARASGELTVDQIEALVDAASD